VLPLVADDARSKRASSHSFNRCRSRAEPTYRQEVSLDVAFKVGDKVVYPHHGAAIIEALEEKELFGEKRDYYILRLAYGELTLMVPTDSIDEVGLREVTPKKEMPKVIKVLKKNEPATNTTNWSRRFKANVEKLKSGDIYQVADVVRSLHQRDKEKGLSAGEKRMLTKARQILVSELTFAQDCNEDEAEQMLDEVLG
jgi:CarD family transcriptional regulator